MVVDAVTVFHISPHISICAKKLLLSLSDPDALRRLEQRLHRVKE